MALLKEHPLASIFPMLEKEDAASLTESIRRSGQREAVVLLDGMILDGRNRYRCTIDAGKQPHYRDYDHGTDGPSPLQFVLDTNLERRQLTTSQRAMIAARALEAQKQEAKALEVAQASAASAISPDEEAPDGTPMGDAQEVSPAPAPAEASKLPTQEQIADSADVSLRAISAATALEKSDPKAAEEVASGKKSLNKATNEARAEKNAEARKAVLKRIDEVCGEPFMKAVESNDKLKTASELAAFVALDDDTMTKVSKLVDVGWAVKRATAHVLNKVVASSTVEDLINHAISGGTGDCVHVVNGYEIAVTKVS